MTIPAKVARFIAVLNIELAPPTPPRNVYNTRAIVDRTVDPAAMAVSEKEHEAASLPGAAVVQLPA
jgi:hypothetical protein